MTEQNEDTRRMQDNLVCADCGRLVGSGENYLFSQTPGCDFDPREDIVICPDCAPEPDYHEIKP